MAAANCTGSYISHERQKQDCTVKESGFLANYSMSIIGIAGVVLQAPTGVVVMRCFQQPPVNGLWLLAGGR